MPNPLIPTFPTLEDCENITMSCYNNGKCSLDSNGSYSCLCNSRFDSTYCCRVSFYYTWQGRDLIMVNITQIIFAIWLILFAVDVTFELKKGKKKRLIELLSPITKFLAILFCSFRIAYLSVWEAEEEGDYLIPRLYLLSSFMYMFGNLCAVSAYYGVILVWIFVVTSTQELKGKPTKHFKMATKIIVIALCIFSPIAFTFYMLTNIIPIMNTLYNIWIAIFLLCGAIWSSYHVVMMFGILRNTRNSVRRVYNKNIYLGIVNFFIILYVISLIVSLFVGLNQPAWDDLMWNSVWRVLELFILSFYFLVAENNVLIMMKKCGNAITQTQTASTGVSPSINRSSNNKSSDK